VILPFPRSGGWATIDPAGDPFTPRPSAEQLLRRAYYPFQAPLLPSTSQTGNTVPLLSRDDYVLLYMPVSNRTEQFYVHMRGTEPALSTPIASLKAGMTAYGWKFKPAGSSPAQKRLAGMAEAQERVIPRIEEVFGHIADAPFFGWQPLQLIWSLEAFRYKTKSFWGITQVFEQRQDAMAFDLRRRLVELVGPQGYRPIEDPTEQLGWMAPACGSLLSPYGRAILSDVYVYWTVKSRMFEYFVRGMRNATTGIPHFKDKSVAALQGMIPGQAEGNRVMIDLTQQVAQSLRILEEYGALVTRAGMDAELIVNEAYARGWEAALDLCNKAMQVRIEFSHLTMELKADSTGSRAIGEVQETSKDKAVRWLCRYTAAEAERGIFNRMLYANLPGLDPDDLPRLVFRVTDRIDPTRATTYKALGGRIDLEAVADDWGLPIMTAEQIAAEDAANAAKAAAAGLPVAGGAAPQPGGVDPNAATGGEPGVDPPSPEDQPG
jgi:hypothetical protein